MSEDCSGPVGAMAMANGGVWFFHRINLLHRICEELILIW